MKILAVGDFHGKFPDKIKKLILKEEPDLILSTGDYAGIEEWRPLIKKFFKESQNGREFSIEEYLGQEKYEKLIKEDFKQGQIPIKELNKFGIPVLSVFGNGDWYGELNTIGGNILNYEKLIKKLKNIVDITYDSGRMNETKIVGFGGYLDPDIYFTKIGMKAINTTPKRTKKRKKRYNKAEKKLTSLMKFNPEILLTHYTPYGCLDKMKEVGFLLNGKNMGVSSYNRAIKKYKPVLVVCGHMHENQGQCKINSTIVVNPGPASEGKAAIIEFDEKEKRVLNVEFIR